MSVLIHITTELEAKLRAEVARLGKEAAASSARHPDRISVADVQRVGRVDALLWVLEESGLGAQPRPAEHPRLRVLGVDLASGPDRSVAHVVGPDPRD